MKAFAQILILTAIGFSPIFAQTVDPCTQSTPLTGGTEVKISTNSQSSNAISGTDYEYELWHNTGESTNEVKMKYYGASQGGGAAFRGEWNESNTKFDYLARVGYKFEKGGAGSGSLYEEYGNIYAYYNYERSGRLDGDNYSYIGIYGWARAGNGANLVEFYIVDDWWGNRHQSDATPVTISTTGGSEIATATIDGATYKIIKNTRNNQPSIEGNKDFDQYFSIRQTPRKCGTISITEHFKAWEDNGLKLGKLYEAKFLAEAGAYDVYNQSTVTSGWIDYRYAAMKMTETPEPQPGVGDGESCITLPANPPTAEQNPYDVCFIYPHDNPKYAGKCYVCKPDNEEGGNDCRSDWVWNGEQEYLDDNLDKGYWYSEIPCRTSSPIALNKTRLTNFSLQALNGKTLLIQANAKTEAQIYDLKGNKVASINVLGGSQTVNLSLPSGVYFAKVNGMQNIKFVLK